MWEEDRENKARNLNSLSHLLFVVVVDFQFEDVRCTQARMHGTCGESNLFV